MYPLLLAGGLAMTFLRERMIKDMQLSTHPEHAAGSTCTHGRGRNPQGGDRDERAKEGVAVQEFTESFFG